MGMFNSFNYISGTSLKWFVFAHEKRQKWIPLCKGGKIHISFNELLLPGVLFFLYRNGWWRDKAFWRASSCLVARVKEAWSGSYQGRADWKPVGARIARVLQLFSPVSAALASGNSQGILEGLRFHLICFQTEDVSYCFHSSDFKLQYA